MSTLPPTPRKKKNSPLLLSFAIIAFVLALIAVMAWFGGTPYGRAWILSHSQASSAPVLSTPVLRKVDYVIKATECAEFNAVYSVPGGTSQMDVPCMAEMSTVGVLVNSSKAHTGDIASFSILNTKGNGRSTFTCNIWVDGKSVASVQSHGIGNTASCTAIVP